MRKVSIFLSFIFLIVIAVTLYQQSHDTQGNRTSNMPNDILIQSNSNDMRITSTKFDNGEHIPSKFTCDGENINPPLLIEKVSPDAVTLAITMHDPDVPSEVRKDRNWDHWILYNLAPDTKSIPENASLDAHLLRNSSGKFGYVGPCPPREYEPTTHRYIFTLYALNTELNLPENMTRSEFESVISEHVIEKAELIGIYERVDN